jgi:hypothetical protein
MRPVNGALAIKTRANQVAAYHESKFKLHIKRLLKKQTICIADKQFDYDGHSVHTRFVLPNHEALRHVSFILDSAIAQVGELHPSYRSVSLTSRQFGLSHTQLDFDVQMQNHKSTVLSLLAGFLVGLGWDSTPYMQNDKEPRPDHSCMCLPHTIHIFDNKSNRYRLSMHACAYTLSSHPKVGSMSVETSKSHVHVNMMLCDAI